MKKSFSETLKEPPAFSRDVYFRDSWGAKLFSWVPFAVVKTITYSPALVLGGVYYTAGPLAAAGMVAGGLCYMYEVFLFPRNLNDFFQPRKLRMQKKANPEPMKKKVAVIGAGPSGVCTVKECLEAGHEVSCYDMNGSVGGTFYAAFWPKGQLVSSPYITCFSDFECERNKDGTEHWKHHTAIEYVEYIKQYVKHFKLEKHIQLKTKVVHVKKDENDKFWITIKSVADEKAQEKTEGPFDHLAMCSGSFNTRNIPKIPGIETFTGSIKHTNDFTALPGTTVEEAFKDVAGKNVVALGLGESLADILDIITLRTTTPVKSAAVAIRQGATVFPRIHSQGGYIVDMASNRFRQSLAKPFRNALHSMMISLKALYGMKIPFRARVQMFIVRSLKRKSPAYTKTTKSDNFISAVEAGKLDLKGPISHVDGDKIYFTDGSVRENVDVLILGTGYTKSEFPYLTEDSFPKMKKAEMMNGSMEKKEMMKEPLMKKDMDMGCDCGSPVAICPTGRYLRIYDPKHGDSIGFIGLGVRPLLGAIPPIAELQARLFAQVCSGNRQLPSVKNMERRIRNDKIHDEYEYSTDNDLWQGLVNFLPYMDLLATEIGCEPNRFWMLTRPALAKKMLLGGPLNHCYRLRGPGAQPELAADIILRSPIEAPKGDIAVVIGANITLSLFYWPNTILRMGRDALDRLVNIVS